ncbi:MAG: hypothetical protein WBG71_10530 [Leeuwenhoekiella sp.]
MRLKESVYSHKITNELAFNWGTLFFMENCCVSEVDEGFFFDTIDINKFVLFLKVYYKGQKFHYINNRVNSFCVNPIGYESFTEIQDQILSTRVILYSDKQRKTAAYEGKFYPLEANFFDNLEACLKDIDYPRADIKNLSI